MPPATAAPTRRSPAGEAWSLMHVLLMSQRTRILTIAAEFELTPGQLFALKSLDPRRPVPMRELATALSCDNSNVTGIVDRLEDRGLVERRAAPSDRRVKMLVVTPAGEEVRARVRERMEEPPAALAALAPEEQRLLRDLMRKALAR
jgi:DNA-binding MarR family transcriptional regulator